MLNVLVSRRLLVHHGTRLAEIFRRRQQDLSITSSLTTTSHTHSRSLALLNIIQTTCRTRTTSVAIMSQTSTTQLYRTIIASPNIRMLTDCSRRCRRRRRRLTSSTPRITEIFL
jgi:hypothetical protein